MMNFDRDKRGSYEEDAPKKTSFKEAFASARKGGEKTFEWNGKKYTTDVAKPKAAPKAEAATPKVDSVSRHKKLKSEMESFKPEARTTPGPITKAMSREGTSAVPAMPKGRMASGPVTEYGDEKPQAFAKGGSVSRRADGIASKGKNKCKMR